MKKLKLITFVGTSLFENFQKCTTDRFIEFENLAEQLPTFAEWYHLGNKTKKLSAKVTKQKRFWQKDRCSAEVGSILKIAEQTNQTIEVHLLATDTTLSVLAAVLVKQWFAENHTNITKVHFELPPEKTHPFDAQSKSRHIVKNLNFKQGNDYEAGLWNLRQVLDNEVNLAKKAGDICMLNITAGYKAIIPMVTLLAYARDVGLLYMYDEQHSLASTPLIKYDLKSLIK
ncbi:hypothetical protein [uncultured Microscilla sp.]|uniref:hypothetical protein n=1 Tax=uncultured Microscilla sp. TaxID=432653 RepID=UPI00261D68A3|nr:hypothetical protein [uncultured Microscilla sp.]